MIRTGPPDVRVVVSCEHGGHQVPEAWTPLFRGAADVLRSHRGWDPGSLALARTLARRLGAPLHQATVSRLVVDLNRSPGHPRVFSEYTRALAPADRRRLLETLHAPYRAAVRGRVTEALAGGGVVLHLSIHSFTPVFEGRERRTDLSLLYDPTRRGERALAAAWVEGLRRRLPGRSVRRNHPYRGVSDGLTTWLRRETGAEGYMGIEVEVSQRWLGGEGDGFQGWVGDALVASLAEALESRRAG